MISAAEAKRQYERAKRLGWIPMFARAAASRPWCTTADLMGIGSRETNLDPIYLTKTGDHGNGFGLMQVDKRYFPEWTSSGLWRDPEECIEKGAQVLTQKRAEIIKSLGHVKTWRTSKGQSMRFTGAPFSDAQLHRISIAAYNSGIAAYHHFSVSGDPDRGTTGKDYSKDVLGRSVMFNLLLKADGVVAGGIGAAHADTQPLPDVSAGLGDAHTDATIAPTPSVGVLAAVGGGGAVAVAGGAAVASSGYDVPTFVWLLLGVLVVGVLTVVSLWALSKWGKS